MLLSEYLKILLDYSKLLSEYLEFPSDFRFPMQKYGKLFWRCAQSGSEWFKVAQKGLKRFTHFVHYELHLLWCKVIAAAPDECSQPRVDAYPVLKLPQCAALAAAVREVHHGEFALAIGADGECFVRHTHPYSSSQWRMASRSLSKLPQQSSLLV